MLDYYQADYTKSGKEMLIELINWANRNTMVKPLCAEETWFTKPVPLTRDKECNTMIRFEKAIGYRGMEYPQDIEYNRVDINQIALLKGFEGEVVLSTGNRGLYTDMVSILDDLYSTFKVKLLPEDIYNDSIKFDYNQDRIDVVLRIHPDSIAYLGELKLTLCLREIRLDTAVRKTRFVQSFQPPYRHVHC